MARSRSPTINRQDHNTLVAVFGTDSSPAETNATLVTLSRLHMLKRKGIIDYEDIPGFRERFHILGWLVSLTALGQHLWLLELSKAS